MTKRAVNDISLKSVADAIRSRAGVTNKLEFPNEYIGTVEGIPDLAISIIDRSATEVKHEKVTSLGAHIFRGSGLQKADFPAVTSVGLAAFHSCTALVSVNLPMAINFDSYAFFGCSSLESISLPKAQHLRSESFAGGNVKLKRVELSSLVQIYASCFSGCSELTELIIRRTDGVPYLTASSPFNGTPIASGTGYIYVPSSLVDSYKSATNWTTYANQFRAIEDYPEITGG